MKFKISAPNDYGSEADYQSALENCYRAEMAAAVEGLQQREPYDQNVCSLPFEAGNGYATLAALEARWDAGEEAAYSRDQVMAEAQEAMEQACSADDGRKMYDALADAATGAGLKYVEETDFGAIWKGTEAQFAACVAALPGWAQRYASKAEE